MDKTIVTHGIINITTIDLLKWYKNYDIAYEIFNDNE